MSDVDVIATILRYLDSKKAVFCLKNHLDVDGSLCYSY